MQTVLLNLSERKNNMNNKIIAAAILALGIISAVVIGNGTFTVLAGIVGVGLLASKEDFVERGAAK